MPGYQIIRDNILFLRQGINLLGQLDEERYVKTITPFFNSGVGRHIRHNLDHYDMLLAGLQTGYIDYDGRQRDPQVETDRHYATQEMLSIITRLKEIDAQHLDDPVSVKMNADNDANNSSSPSQSTVRRELQFLLSHTVHHYAIIAIILKMQGFDCDENFGVAPSTLKYQQHVRN